MKQLRVFTDFAEDITELNDSEKGRLFQAMLDYAKTGTAPDLRGNEKYVWPTAKKNIDKQKESYEEVCRTNKRIATERYGASRSVTERNGACEDKEKEKDKDKENKKKTSKEKADAFSELAGDDKTLLEALRDFETMRNRIKKPMTDRAKAILVGELQKRPRKDWIPVLDQSIINSWQGIYDLKPSSGVQKKPGYNVQHHADALTDYEKAAIASMLEDYEDA